MENITSNTCKVSPSNKESGNEPILEDNTDHIDSKNEIIHELLDVEFEHLQRRYQPLLDQSNNQAEHTISNDQCSNETTVTNRYKVTESNAKNPELNKVIPPLKKVRLCEEQLTEVRKKYHDKYITFTNNKQLLSDHPFPKGTCLIAGDSILAGRDENRLSTVKHKIRVRYFPGARADDIYDYMKPLLRKLPDYIIFHIGTNDAVNNTSREILDKILKLKTYIQKELPKCQITVSTPIKRHDHGKSSLTISHLCKKFKDISISIVDNSNIGAFYLNIGGLHLNDKGLGKLAINLKLKVRKL